MNVKLILYIAYTACAGTDFRLVKRNPFQLTNALTLINFNICIHFFQMFLLLPGRLNTWIGKFEDTHILLFAFFFLGMIFLMNQLFTRRVLIQAIRTYKHSDFATRSKWIAFGYSPLNCLFAVLIGF